MIRIAIGVVHVVVVERAVVVKGIAQIEEGVLALFLLGAAAADDIFPVGGLVQISRGGSWSGPCLDRRCDEIACPAVRGSNGDRRSGRSPDFGSSHDCAFPSSLSGILQPAPRYSGGTVPAFTGFPIGESLIGSAIPCLSTPDLKYEFFIAS